jgi:hypothetical protein
MPRCQALAHGNETDMPLLLGFFLVALFSRKRRYVYRGLALPHAAPWMVHGAPSKVGRVVPVDDHQLRDGKRSSDEATLLL